MSKKMDRRTALTAMGGLAAAAVAPIGAKASAAHADSELIKLCLEHDNRRGEVAKFYALYRSGFEAVDDALERSTEAKHALAETIASISASTIAGVQARARVLEHILDDEDHYSEEHDMMRSIIRDITALRTEARA